jgi:hypothetical protein
MTADNDRRQRPQATKEGVLSWMRTKAVTPIEAVGA